jgi:hypothetical protein
MPSSWQRCRRERSATCRRVCTTSGLNSKLVALPKEIAQPAETVKPAEPIIGIISFNKSFFKVYDPTSLPIEMNLTKGSKISIDIFSDSTFIKNEKYVAKKNIFKFEFQPKVGKNIL